MYRIVTVLLVLGVSGNVWAGEKNYFNSWGLNEPLANCYNGSHDLIDDVALYAERKASWVELPFLFVGNWAIFGGGLMCGAGWLADGAVKLAVSPVGVPIYLGVRGEDEPRQNNGRTRSRKGR